MYAVEKLQILKTLEVPKEKASISEHYRRKKEAEKRKAYREYLLRNQKVCDR